MTPNLGVVQTSTGATTAITASSVAATFANPTSNGNLIVVGINGGTSTVASVSDGVNTYVQAEPGNNTWADCEIWYARNISRQASPTVTATFVGTMPATIHIYEVSGADISAPLDQHTNNAGNGVASNTPTVTTAITTNTNELVFAVGNVYLGAGTDTFTVGAGYSNFTTTNSTPTLGITTTSGAETAVIGSKAPQTATFGLSFTGSTWEISIATFKAYTQGTTTSTSFTTSTSMSSTSVSSTSSSISSTSASTSTSSTSTSLSITTISTSSTSSSISSTSISSTSSSTSLSSTSSSISSTSVSSTSQSSTSSSTSISSTSTSFSSTSSSISSTSSSVSSTSFSSTSSSSSTSTTTLPPPYLTYSYQDDSPFTTTLQFGIKSPTIWVCPPNVTSVLAECWGAGGGGGGCSNGTAQGGGGGGGGGYSNATVSVIPGTSYTVTVGLAGTAGVSGGASPGGTGGNSLFSNSSTVLAIGGTGGGGGSGGGAAGGAGGASGSGVGTIKTSGGTGGAAATGANTAGGGGGGSGGSVNNGGNGGAAGASEGTAGNAGAVIGGRGGVGNAAILSTPGGGGGGADSTGGSAAGFDGAAGFVQLTFRTNPPPTGSSNQQIPFNAVKYGDVSTDDGDYFVERGTGYLIREYKSLHTNNTDSITMTWKGRSTISTLRSPILIQIFNVNSGNWETLANQTLVPADTDFQVIVSQTTNPSNYYDSTNTVTFRSYQQVI